MLYFKRLDPDGDVFLYCGNYKQQGLHELVGVQDELDGPPYFLKFSEDEEDDEIEDEEED